MEMMLDKNKTWVIFLFEFKMGHKAGGTTCNINHAFGPGTANKCTVQWWFKKFCKGDESLEDEHNGQPLEVDKQQSRAIVEADPLPTTWEGAKELNVDHLTLCSFGIWNKLERWKSPISGCLMSWLKIKTIIILKCHLLSSCTTTTNHFLIGLWCAMKSEFYMATGNE